MGQTASASDSTAAERGRYLVEHLPSGLFRTDDAEPGVPQLSVAWRIATAPFRLAPSTVEHIASLGPPLLAFYRALSALYARSARGTAPGFIAEYLDVGKPEAIVKLARQNRFKSEIPQVIRPDLILTDDGGYIASELDSVPGGMGFVGAMAHTYHELGFETVGDTDGMPREFAAMLAATAHKERPVVAIVVSDESGDYRNELRWLAQRMRERDLADAHVVIPQDVVFTEEALFMRLEDGREEKIDVLYRNFELFDLLNVPKQELMLYAARHNRVKLTPPPKAPLEEKSSFALLHHPALAALWKKELGDDVFARLISIFPQTWVIDPRPLPPHAAIIGLTAGGRPVSDWMALEALGKSERDFVVKPSGFSELAWGSRGVRVANDLTKEQWHSTLLAAVEMYPKTPHILQRFHKGRRVIVEYYDRSADTVKTMDGRVRLCPYYFVVGDETRLGGILATIAPADKRLIHGMADAVMAPCTADESGA
ncbi:MAG: hypothetical protein ABSB70_14255 [Candidatus Velthaea sp.]